MPTSKSDVQEKKPEPTAGAASSTSAPAASSSDVEVVKVREFTAADGTTNALLLSASGEFRIAAQGSYNSLAGADKLPRKFNVSSAAFRQLTKPESFGERFADVDFIGVVNDALYRRGNFEKSKELSASDVQAVINALAGVVRERLG